MNARRRWAGASNGRVSCAETPIRRHIYSGPGPWKWKEYGVRETGPARSRCSRPIHPFPLRGSRPWNLRIEFSSVWIAARNLCSPRVNSSSFTTNNSRMIPSAASSARPNARTAAPGCARKRGPSARLAARRQRCPSVPRRGGRCCADPASRSSRRHQPDRHHPFPRRTSFLTAP